MKRATRCISSNAVVLGCEFVDEVVERARDDTRLAPRDVVGQCFPVDLASALPQPTGEFVGPPEQVVGYRNRGLHTPSITGPFFIARHRPALLSLSTPTSQTPGGHARWDLVKVRAHLGYDTPTGSITGLKTETFAPAGTTVLDAETPTGPLPLEMVALGVREDAEPIGDAGHHRWGGSLLRRRPS